ncbi:uncharacterized protein UDID_01505 [Ustilago sp. UG-2017a]|nr:uncharacterized protein UDID_01505 [Ustilago sp. UG-2017a]
MADKEAIVISDSDSDTLSESERPLPPPPKQATTSRSAVVKQRNGQDDMKEQVPEAGPSAPPSTAANGLLGLFPNRRQLELERKERARKRRREQGLASSSSEDEETQVEAKRSKPHQALPSAQQDPHAPLHKPAPIVERGKSSSTTSNTPSSSSSGSSFSSATSPINPKSRFWTGTIKHGYNTYASISLSGTTIPSLLLPATPSSRNTLQLAVLATYDLRMDWLHSLFPRNLPVTLILPPPKEDYRSGDPTIARPGLYPSEVFVGFERFPGWKICVPNKPKGGWLTQHMKFLVLVHEGWLRVAIASGNLNEVDWSRIENGVFIQDFPLKGGEGSSARAEGRGGVENDFKEQLTLVLKSLSVPTSHPVWTALDRFDFSLGGARARIVASWPEASSLQGWDRIETQGLGRLGKVVRNLDIPAVKGGMEVECQGSSLANHDLKWIEHFHLLASGVDPRGKLPFKGKPNEAHPEYRRAIGGVGGALPPVKVVFPHHRYVEQETVEGPMGALSFFGKAETFSSSPIKRLYYSPQSRRGDVMIHAKSLLALTPKGATIVDQAFWTAADAQLSGSSRQPLPRQGESEWQPNLGETPIGWSYLGSSNFTRAAHGNISGTVQKPTQNGSNWELGVVMPIYASEVEKFGVEAESLRPIVYHRPLQQYGSEDTPWDNSSALAMF